MRMRRCRSWARVLALVVMTLAALVVAPTGAHADDEVDGNQDDRVIRIGPQVTLVESDDGKLRMWDDDPSQEAPKCESQLGCWMNWVEMVTGVAVLVPRNISDGAGLPGGRSRTVTRPCAMLEQRLCRGKRALGRPLMTGGVGGPFGRHVDFATGDGAFVRSTAAQHPAARDWRRRRR